MKFLKIRKKPVTVHAFQIDDNFLNNIEIPLRTNFNNHGFRIEENGIFVDTLEGIMKAKKGDWIIKGVNGEIYPCDDKVFKKTYNIIGAE